MKIIEIPIGGSLKSVVEKERLKLDGPSLLFLLPDIPAVKQAEKLFLENGLWGERLLTFGKLSAIYNIKREKKSLPLSRMGRLFLMEDTVGKLRDGLLYFRNASNLKGFSESLLGVVAELKHAELSPADLLDIKKRLKDEELESKFDDLANVFKLYQTKLSEEGYIDDIDALKILSESARNGELKGALPEAEKFIVFGFYDFTASQMDALKSIDAAGFDVIICLPCYGGAPGFGAQVTERLKDRFGNFEIEKQPEIYQPKSCVEIHSFPSFREEAEFGARQAKRLIVENSLEPDDIAVILRSPSGKERDVMSAFEKLGVPCCMSSAVSLRESSLGQFVISLLKAKASNFERRLFLRLLRERYLSEFFDGIDNLDEFLSELDLQLRKRRILGGIKDWKEALREFANKEFAGSVENLIGELENGFNSNTLGELAEKLGQVMVKLSVPETVKKLSSESDAEFSAWEKFANFLKELCFLSKIRFRKNLTLEDFIALLEDLMTEEKFCHTSIQQGKVWMLNCLEARGTRFQAVFILDAGEKSFPAPAKRDPVLKNDERALINSLLRRNALDIERNHYEAEEFLFSMICASASKNLYITYSYLDEKERAVSPSYPVEELCEREKTEVKKHTSEDCFLKPENIYTRCDLAKHLLHTGAYDKEPFAEYLRRNWRPHESALSGIRAERMRLASGGDYCGFEGIITRKELLPETVEFFPTRLETYGDCPFKYFAGKVLGLEKFDEVEDDVSALDLGSFYHKALKELLESLADEMGGRVDLTGVTDEKVLNRLREVLGRLDFGKEFHWLSPTVRDIAKRRAVEEVLPLFVLAEAGRIRHWNALGFYPAHFEKELSSKIGNVRIRGTADRIDIGKDGALIVDYKFRSSSGKEFFDYKNLQLPLYLSALRKGIKPYGGFYRFVEKPEEEKGFTGDKKSSVEELINAAKKQVETYVSLMGKGFFAPVIAKKEMAGFEKQEISMRKDDEYPPCRLCEFGDLCRVHTGAKRRMNV